jgi:hypothetical protein
MVYGLDHFYPVSAIPYGVITYIYLDLELFEVLLIITSPIHLLSVIAPAYTVATCNSFCLYSSWSFLFPLSSESFLAIMA